jgi:hypothetical protein
MSDRQERCLMAKMSAQFLADQCPTVVEAACRSVADLAVNAVGIDDDNITPDRVGQLSEHARLLAFPMMRELVGELAWRLAENEQTWTKTGARSP